MISPPCRIALLALAATAVVSACTGDATSAEPRTPGIHVVSGHPASDTIDAVLPPLILRIRDQHGTPAVATAVRFVVGFEGNLLVRSGPTAAFEHSTWVRTDDRGRATVHVRLGGAAGEGALRVDVPSLEMSATLRFAIRPGAPVRIRVSPHDTAVFVSAAFAASVTGLDRSGTAVPVTASLESASPATVVLGSTVRAASVGRAAIVARYDAFVDTAWVSVVPPGFITAHRTGHVQGTLVTMQLDGTAMREIAPTNHGQPQSPLTAAWAGDGRHLLLSDYPGVNGGPHRIYRVDSSTGARTLISPDIGYGHYYPTYSPDGKWIYFAAEMGALTWGVWRMRPDGSHPEEIVPHEHTFVLPRPSISPDGSRLVYSMGHYSDPRITVVDLESGESRMLSVRGFAPQWSPSGGRIAYFTATAVGIVSADGGANRLLSESAFTDHSHIRWSHDEEWLLTAPNHLLELVSTSSGETLPLPYSGLLRAPEWMP